MGGILGASGCYFIATEVVDLSRTAGTVLWAVCFAVFFVAAQVEG
jgi:hypothetical protein